jgi:hypothetical protein
MGQNSIDRIVDTVLAVAGGASSKPAVVEALGLVGREGHYFIDTALELGLLSQDAAGKLKPTDRAVRILSARDAIQRRARLRHALRQVGAVQRILDFLQQYPLGCTRLKLVDVIGQQWTLGDLSADRRAELLLTWLQELELIREERGVVRAVDGLASR